MAKAHEVADLDVSVFRHQHCSKNIFTGILVDVKAIKIVVKAIKIAMIFVIFRFKVQNFRHKI